jgi:hypothetical protein
VRSFVRRLRSVLGWFSLTDQGIGVPGPLAVLKPTVVGEAEELMRREGRRH